MRLWKTRQRTQTTHKRRRRQAQHRPQEHAAPNEGAAAHRQRQRLQAQHWAVLGRLPRPRSLRQHQPRRQRQRRSQRPQEPPSQRPCRRSTSTSSTSSRSRSHKQIPQCRWPCHPTLSRPWWQQQQPRPLQRQKQPRPPPLRPPLPLQQRRQAHCQLAATGQKAHWQRSRTRSGRA